MPATSCELQETAPHANPRAAVFAEHEIRAEGKVIALVHDTAACLRQIMADALLCGTSIGDQSLACSGGRPIAKCPCAGGCAHDRRGAATLAEGACHRVVRVMRVVRMVRVVTMWAVAVASATATAASTAIVELSPAAATTIADQRGMPVDRGLEVRTGRRTRPLANLCIRVAESSCRRAAQTAYVYTLEDLLLLRPVRWDTASCLNLLQHFLEIISVDIKVEISTETSASGVVDGVGARAARKAAVHAYEAHR